MKHLKQIDLIPLFQGLSREQHQELARITVEQEYDRGQTIFSEGDEASGFYVVVSGLIKIYKLSPDGKEQILHLFGPGEPFAEVAVFAGSSFPAHALALKKSRVFFFPRDLFAKLLADPSMSMNMLASLSLRLKHFASMIEALSLKEVPGRLASYLLYLNSSQDDSGLLQLNIAKTQLASLLGTMPETLSRILARMHKQEMIRLEGANIRIMDQPTLEKLASGENRLE